MTGTVKPHVFSLRALSAAVLLALALPAHAGLFDDDEARARIEKLRTDLNGVQAAADGARQNQIDVNNQLESIRQELARLRGQLEVLANDVDTTQKRQKDFYVDLDTRLRKIEAGGAAAAAAGTPGLAPNETAVAPDAGLPTGERTGSRTPVDETAATRDYEIALNFVRGGRYRDAISSFANFNRVHAGSERQPSAHFWQGSSHMQLREFAKAADQFARVASGWPNDPKAPDALLNQANAQQEMGDAKGATRTLETLVQQYPKSSAAQTAKTRLVKKKP